MSRKPPDNKGFAVGGGIGPNAGVSAWFEQRIVRLCQGMSEATIKEVTRLFERAGRGGKLETGSLSSQARILLNRLGGDFESIFEDATKELAQGMLKRVLKANAAGMRTSLKEIAQGMTIKPHYISGALKENLKAAVAENVNLIKSIQQQHHSKVVDAVMRSITTGQGMKDLVPELHKIGRVSEQRARFIARDQICKANSFITAERFKGAGIKHFKWIHSGRAKQPRRMHELLDGTIWPFDAPPEIERGVKGLPGQLINCRCRMAPALESAYLDFRYGGNDEGE